MNRSLRSVVLRWLPALLLGVAPAGARAADPKPAPPAEEKLTADGLALLRTWTPPAYPPAELKARHSGMVTVRLIVDEAGKVTQARALEDSDAKFVDAALAAVKAWGFAPAVENGRPAACCLDTLVAFSPAVGQQKPSAIPPEQQRLSPAQRRSPEPRVAPPGEYPSVLVDRKLPGKVRFSCTVTPEGRAVKVVVTGATHVDFVLPALRALAEWEFQPGMQGDLAVTAPVEGLVTFDSIVGQVGEVFAANGLTAPDGTPPAVTPEPVFVVDPVEPLDRLLQGEGGAASVEFTVTETGYVRDVKVREASQPEFGYALQAAMESWGFARPVENFHGVSVALVKHAEFAAIPLAAGPADDADPVARVVRAMRRGEIGGAKGLDEKLTPIYRVAPVYPASLKLAEGGAPKGAAEIEIVIDRDGRVRLPRIVSATRDEFGWAAATAVAQWIFKAPRRGGVAADVKVRVPFGFAAPVE